MTKTFDFTAHRPRLEQAGAYAVGPSPANPSRQTPAPEPTPTDPLAALDARFETPRQECRTSLHGGDLAGLVPLGHGDLDWLNRELEGIKRLNRELSHLRRSRAVDAWPTPVLPPEVLFGPRDVLAVLDLAQRVLAATRARPSPPKHQFARTHTDHPDAL